MEDPHDYFEYVANGDIVPKSGLLLVKFWTRRKSPYLSRKNETNVQQRRLGEVLCGVPE